MTFHDWIAALSPLAAAGVGWWLRRVLANQDKQRDGMKGEIAKVLQLIQDVKDEFAGIKETLATVKTQSGYHHDEITRFRNLIDRWNQGPPK